MLLWKGPLVSGKVSYRDSKKLFTGKSGPGLSQKSTLKYISYKVDNLFVEPNDHR